MKSPGPVLSRAVVLVLPILASCNSGPLIAPPAVSPTASKVNVSRYGADHNANQMISRYEEGMSTVCWMLWAHRVVDGLDHPGFDLLVEHLIEEILGPDSRLARAFRRSGWVSVGFAVVEEIAERLDRPIELPHFPTLLADEADLKRQNKAYARGINRLQCTIDAVTQAKPETLSPEDKRIRRALLTRVIRTVQRGVYLEVNGASLGESDAPPLSSEDRQDDQHEYWRRRTRQCLTATVGVRRGATGLCAWRE